ncbi:Auxin efflux carrier [Venustampulla echinocandica]|uniref:Auxin efflux carrier n=1 Tax=Venustampulla echinocandica TaxID=2656787 RepID=A0A370TZW8_9HELO|nr:Auxin efflux carrier [Venustampulla echinocandica]RDL41076.1 Auxin efflux carrier [Venustampulla echinocandica]
MAMGWAGNLLSTPTSYRLNAAIAGSSNNGHPSIAAGTNSLTAFGSFAFLGSRANTHDAHPDLGRLILLVFEAVMEVVCVSLPGYIIARQGMFDAENQKFAANLNVALFTPCLIFTKLASQLNADKLLDLAIIPVIFVVQTLVSYLVSILVSKAFKLKKRPTNFVTAMGVFGNSNSLPISLVISLSQTLKGLHWDKIPGDNDDEVSARGILYLLIFQQLGQLVRWSWGYHVLLAPAEKYESSETPDVEEGRYRDDPTGDLIIGLDGNEDDGSDQPLNGCSSTTSFDSGGRTPVHYAQYAGSFDSDDDDDEDSKKKPSIVAPTKGNPFYDAFTNGHITSFPSIRTVSPDEQEIPSGIKGIIPSVRLHTRRVAHYVSLKTREASDRVFHALPNPLQHVLSKASNLLGRFFLGLWEFMNPPLWAMLLATIVASVPQLQRLFFQEGSFIANSVTRAVSQSGGVAVPLILVVLGANLARNTQSREALDENSEENKIGTKLLVASLISRMLLPTIIMAPLLALMAKFVPISILGDPIFVIVCFLLTGAPSALQLAQICQINGVYEGVMSKLLFQSYVIWILPSTLILVMCALQVVEWAAV